MSAPPPSRSPAARQSTTPTSLSRSWRPAPLAHAAPPRRPLRPGAGGAPGPPPAPRASRIELLHQAGRLGRSVEQPKTRPELDDRRAVTIAIGTSFSRPESAICTNAHGERLRSVTVAARLDGCHPTVPIATMVTELSLSVRRVRLDQQATASSNIVARFQLTRPGSAAAPSS